MVNPFKSLKRFYNNEVKSSPAFAGVRMLGKLTNPTTWAAPLDQWLGTDLSGDRAAMRREEQRRYALGLVREDSAYQRAYADARAAGINPNIHGINPASSQAAGAGDVTAGRVDASQGSLGNLMGALTSLGGLTIQSQANQIAQQNADVSLARTLADIGLKSRDLEVRSEAQNLLNDTIRHNLAIAQGKEPPNSLSGYNLYGQHPPQENPLGAMLNSFIDEIEASDGEVARWLKDNPLYRGARAAGRAFKYYRSSGKRNTTNNNSSIHNHSHYHNNSGGKK